MKRGEARVEAWLGVEARGGDRGEREKVEGTVLARAHAQWVDPGIPRVAAGAAAAHGLV
eukprot:CAMPEP_0182583636 /NCGR_PEP_ID=MMETSP1324-20130603/55638_1 /TAXON_ID=236786 /ORGANISM="Florenciella sp., Strain RCC1587" /LENGTH=58 /DNA_ID=CAMNT_0024800213 /DNA_START=24 /DNA_END=197 /DNA_ORIENTATION=-